MSALATPAYLATRAYARRAPARASRPAAAVAPLASVPTPTSVVGTRSSRASFLGPARPAAAILDARARVAGTRARRSSTIAPRAAAGAATAMPSPDGPASSASDDGVSVVAIARAMLFYFVTFTLALPLFAIMLAMFPFAYLTDRYRRYALSFVNDVWACVSTFPFFKVEVIGRENLPSVETPAVYVANHASYLDIYSLFHLRRPFKFISKVSNFIIPIIGWSMYMTGHIALKRTDRKSQMKTLKDCRELLQNECSVLFFPEGTRSKDGTMADFKKGAFSVAAKEKALVVPITLVGTSERMKNGKEWMLRAGGIKVVVHKPVRCEDAQKCCDESYKVIKEGLVQYS